jgi:hypothetical protein
MKIKIKHIILIFPLLLVGCGTIFQGYYYNVKLNVSEKTMVFDSNKYEIPIETDVAYKTNDTIKYIELRTSENYKLTFINDNHFKNLYIEHKLNNLTLVFDLLCIGYLGIPLIVDCANRNIYKFDDITLTKNDFTHLVYDSSQFIRTYDIAYQAKITNDSINDYRMGLIFYNSGLSLFVGFGSSTLTRVIPSIIMRGAIGFRLNILKDFDVILQSDYNAFDEQYRDEYTGEVYRSSFEIRYHPLSNDSWYISAGIDYLDAHYEKSFLRDTIIGPVAPKMKGISVGAGYGGKWWFVDGTYSLGFNKIRLDGIKPFLLSYFSFGIYFNLPI